MGNILRNLFTIVGVILTTLLEYKEFVYENFSSTDNDYFSIMSYLKNIVYLFITDVTRTVTVTVCCGLKIGECSL